MNILQHNYQQVKAAIAAAEAAVGLAVILSAYRRRKTVEVDDLDTMYW
mgnify:CR=1 FL=1